jgi:hypothetical protein
MSPCLHGSMSPCLHASMSLCLYVSILHVSMSPCLQVSMSPCPRLHVSRIPKTENGTNGKRQLPFVFCKRKTEMENFRLFTANRNRKQTFDFLGRQTINGNRRLLFWQTCLSIVICYRSKKNHQW